ncbi:MAG: hypothetical protein L0H29_04045, partial [Sinobacteraceae bacterium]|nr:hypothetical protein [Nevskiaceae bacterium]
MSNCLGRLSLSARLLIAATCVLAVFMVLTGEGLEQAFVQSALQGQRERSQGLAYGLISATQFETDGKPYVPPSALPDPRLARVQSGLEAIIFDSRGRVAWHSSNLSGPLPKIKAPHVGDSLLKETDKQFVFSLGIRWHRGNGKAPRYTIALLTNKTTYEAQLNTFRRSLWLALGVAGATLMLLQFVLLRWSLAPLRRLAREV